LYGVILPGHFFCRYDDGKTRINIEPNRSGFAHPDGYYRERYSVDRQPWYDMRNLSKREVVGVACYNAGALCLNREKFDAALGFFNESVRKIPDFKEAQADRALTFAKKGDLDSAMTGFERLFTDVPGLCNLAANYGSVAMAARDYQKALQVFRKGSSLYPSDTVLLSGIARAYACLGMRDSAKAAAARVRS
jgi:tetratricopeptide (TPR) repeat protein